MRASDLGHGIGRLTDDELSIMHKHAVETREAMKLCEELNRGVRKSALMSVHKFCNRSCSHRAVWPPVAKLYLDIRAHGKI
jgi:hypothetical protein